MDNRKSQIIELALKLIQEKGYVAFSYDDISKQLGVTKASIHYHFERKEDLGLAICDRIELALANLFVSTESISTIVEEQFWHYISKRVEKLRDIEICPISSFQANFESLPAHLQQKVQRISQMELDFLVQLLSKEQKAGLVRSPEETQALAATILTCVKGSLQYKRVLGNDFVPQVFSQLKRILN
jgi:TetR/AcrR family transcriptional repressor of nem operon